MRRLVVRSLIAVTALVGVALVALALAVASSLLHHEGTLALPGIAATVRISEDAHGIPHIKAQSWRDAAFAQGFLHAEARLWQMEFLRRVAQGRLAEMLGPAAVDTDRFLRALGLYRAAKASVQHLDADTQAVLAAYSEGVNAYVSQRRGLLPPEFLLLRVTPEPWTPTDSVAMIKLLALDLATNFRTELQRLRLSKHLSLAQINELLLPDTPPPATRDYVTLYRELASQSETLVAMGEGLAALAGEPVESMGSNNWVVSGARSESGKPLLANDPHLALGLPSTWFLIHLATPQGHLVGASSPGIPLVVLGHNGQVAWGFTNTYSDVQDLYIEALDPSDASRYRTPDGTQAFETRSETIRVRGADPVTLTLRGTRHGPVISDALADPLPLSTRRFALALAWPSLDADDTTPQGLVKLAQARDWNSFLAALRDVRGPQQNVVYADIAGHIGLIAPGRVPIRKPDNDLAGLAPAPGWEARYDWAGWVPFDDLPRQFDPPRGWVATANQRLDASMYKGFLSHDWQPSFRFERIGALLDARGKHSPESFAAMQADVMSPIARSLLPRLLGMVDTSVAREREAVKLLSAWDGHALADSAAPLIAHAWLRSLTRALYADELGDLFNAMWSPRLMFVSNVFADHNGASRWCDDVRTPNVTETCAVIARRALGEALDELTARYGKDMSAWRWGDAHFAALEHRPLSRVAVASTLFDRRVAVPGDTYTVNVGANTLSHAAEPFASRHAAGLRAIYDLADLSRSRFVIAGGQSGHPLSRDYDAFADRWRRGESVTISMDEASVAANARRTLTLAPQ